MSLTPKPQITNFWRAGALVYLKILQPTMHAQKLEAVTMKLELFWLAFFFEAGSEALAAKVTLGINGSDSQSADSEFVAGRNVGVSFEFSADYARSSELWRLMLHY
jgi:hypothetical protein